jgi:hypothetical protein
MGRPPRFCFGLALCLAVCGVSAAQSTITATITGRLLQKRGETEIPLLDCTVFARSIDNGPLVGEYPDAQGRFRLDFPADSRVTVGTICPGYQIFEINGRRTVPPTHDCSAPGPCADVQLTLQPLAVIEGNVVDHNGMPLEQISVQLRQTGTPRERGRQAVSDDRGYFRFFHLTPGDYELEPIIRGGQQEGFTWEGDPQRLSVSAGDVVSAGQVRLRLVEPIELTGRIAGLPPGTTNVFLSLQGRDDTTHWFGQSVEVDAEGRFRMTGVPPGNYQVQMQVFSPDRPTERTAFLGPVDLRTVSGEVAFTRSDPGSLKGTLEVEWPDRDDLPGPSDQDAIAFRLVSEEGFDQWVHAMPPEHTFQLDNLPAGTYKLIFRGPGSNVTQLGSGGEWEPVEQVVIRAGQTTELPLRVRFEMGRLSIFVKPAPGSEEASQNKPAAYYVVGIRGGGRGALYPTDQNGRLVMRYFARGDYEICAWRAMSPQEVEDPEIWRKAGDAVRKFNHEGSVDMEITLTAAP